MTATLREFVGDGVRTQHLVDFTLGYLDKEHVYLFLNHALVDDQLAYTWISDTEIQLDAPVADGVPYYMRRIVPKDELFNDFSDGALLRALELDQGNLQALMILEELEDGYFGGKSFQMNVREPLNMNDNVIFNLRASAFPTSAVTLEQLNAALEGVSRDFVTASTDEDYTLSLLNDHQWMDITGVGLGPRTITVPSSGVPSTFVHTLTNYSDDTVTFRSNGVSSILVDDNGSLVVPPNGTVGIKRSDFAAHIWTLFGNTAEPVAPVTDPHFASVILLLHGGSVEGGTVFLDSSLAATPNPAFDGVTTTVAVAKFDEGVGGGSIRSPFGAIGDGLNYTGTSDFNLGAGEFTIEGWVLMNDYASAPNFYASNRFQHATWFSITNGYPQAFTSGAGVYGGVVDRVILGEWNHVAYTREADDSMHCYLNGKKMVNPGSDNSEIYGDVEMNIAQQSNDVADVIHFDDIRVTAGVCRYTEDFTVPTEPYPDE